MRTTPLLNHKNTLENYMDVVSSLFFFNDPVHEERVSLVSEEFYNNVKKNSKEIQEMIDY